MNRTKKDIGSLFWFVKEHMRVKDLLFIFTVFEYLKEYNSISFENILKRYVQLCKTYKFSQISRRESLDLINDLRNHSVLKFDIVFKGKHGTLTDIESKSSSNTINEVYAMLETILNTIRT